MSNEYTRKLVEVVEPLMIDKIVVEPKRIFIKATCSWSNQARDLIDSAHDNVLLNGETFVLHQQHPVDTCNFLVEYRKNDTLREGKLLILKEINEL